MVCKWNQEWMGRRTQKNADKIRGYFIIGLAMCTISFNNAISPQNSTLSITSHGDRLRPAEVCHQVSLDVNLNQMLFSTWVVPLVGSGRVLFVASLQSAFLLHHLLLPNSTGTNKRCSVLSSSHKQQEQGKHAWQCFPFPSETSTIFTPWIYWYRCGFSG